MNHQARRELGRSVQFDHETRDGRPVLKGHAAVFNSVSEDLGFRETLAPGSLPEPTPAPHSDQLLLFSDDTPAPLARWPGQSPDLGEDSRGLTFEAGALAKHLTLGRDVSELCREGIITQCSFGFTVAKEVMEPCRRRRPLPRPRSRKTR